MSNASTVFRQGSIAALLMTGLSGLLAVIVALKAASFAPPPGLYAPWQEHVFRILAFAALSVWSSLALGFHRKDFAVILTLAFATAVCFAVTPLERAPMPPLLAANLGIVLAYLAMHFYWRARQGRG